MPWSEYVRVEFSTKVGFYVDSGSYKNYAEVHSPMDASFPFTTFPNWDTWSRRSNASVNVVELSSAAISKTSSTPFIPAGEDAVYDLQFGNPGPDDVETMDAIDILPYDGDTRGSAITPGSFTLADVTSAYPNLEMWVSDTDPATLGNLDGTADDMIDPRHPGITAPGGDQWPCTFTQASLGGTPGCPDPADVTAIRFIGVDPDPGASGPGDSFVPAGEGPFDITITYHTTTGARPGDTFDNGWVATFEGLSLPVTSDSDIAPTVPPVGIGDLVAIDVDGDGAYTDGVDLPVEGVDIELYEAAATIGVDPPVGTATTGSAGRWFIGDLPNGDYVVHLPASNTAPGGPLEGRTPASGATADPNDDVDEAGDHNALGASGVVTGPVTLGIAAEPIGDGPVPAGHRDVDTNGTVDLLFEGGSALEVAKTVYDGHTGGADCPGAELDTAAPLAPVTWCVSVTNTGDTHLAGITLDDPDLGFTTPGFDLAAGDPTLLAPGETVSWFVETRHWFSLDNKVTGRGTPATSDGADIPGAAKVTDADGASLVVSVVPDITLAKTVRAGHSGGAGCPGSETVTGATGMDVTYCYRITNVGNVHLAGVTLDDPDLGITEADVTLGSGPGNPALLAPGDSFTWYFETSATANLSSTAETTGDPAAPNGNDITGVADVTDEDGAEVQVSTPTIALLKQVTLGHDGGTGCPGDDLVEGPVDSPITYCFQVTNTGTTALSTVSIIDPDLGIDQDDMILVSGDPAMLAPGERVRWYFETTIDGDLVNSAAAAGLPVGSRGRPLPGVKPPIDSDRARVREADPAIAIDKEALTPIVTAGGEADFRITVTNTGEVDLYRVEVTDDTTATCARTEPKLKAGEKVVHECSGPAGEESFTNVAEVTASLVDEECLPGWVTPPCVSDRDEARVEVVEPELIIRKTPENDLVEPGGIATFRFTLINRSTIDIEDVVVEDETFPECSRDIGTIEAGETTGYTCDIVVPAGSDRIVNVANVSGTRLNHVVRSYASATITVVTTLPVLGSTSAVPASPLASTGTNSAQQIMLAMLLVGIGLLFLVPSFLPSFLASFRTGHRDHTESGGSQLHQM